MPEGCAPGRPRPYDWREEGQEADATPAHGLPRPCPRCAGTGVIRWTPRRECPMCDGTGEAS